MTGAGKQRGLTLLELMLALTVSLILLLGASRLFLTIRHSHNVAQGLSRLQENARFIMTLLPRDVRQAGALGCNSIDALGTHIDNTLAEADQFAHRFNNILTGFHAAASGAILPSGSPATADARLPHVVRKHVVPGTDIIVIRAARIDGVAVALDSADRFKADDLLAISDCHDATLFKYDGTTSSVPSAGYGADARLMQLDTVVYYIRKNSRDIPALYRYSLGKSQELAPGVEYMRILYGQDTNADGSVNRWVDANANELDMAQVVAVRIGLLMRAVNENRRVADKRTYNVLDKSFTPAHAPDRYQRQLYTTTILLRNRASSGV